MSTAATRIPLADALAEAQTFRALFDGMFERWEFAGSLRRRTTDIGDIEHVAIPAVSTSPNLLNEPESEQNHSLRQRARELLDRRHLALHDYGGSTRFGPRYMGFDYSGRTHELFVATSDNWGVILAIRTGSADFSRDLMVRLRRNGYRVSGGRLWRAVDYWIAKRQQESLLLDDETWGVPIACTDEFTLFTAAGYAAVIPPEERQ
ncbi:MAG: hypothetical protein HUU22_19015 [Phycisphaerae bacterium]|nr:hypothetical protein [Phycisphaerae bacterium]NUQ48109.1 hypothetical protein [Phycisphaerae bacterium]